MAQTFDPLATLPLDEVLHKLSQPLTALRGALDLGLQLSRTPEDFRGAIGEALEHADRLIRLKRILAELARESSSETRRLSLAEPVEVALESSMELASDRSIRLEWVCPEPLPVQVDSQRIAVALANVLQMAISYCSPGAILSVAGLRSAGRAVLLITTNRGLIPEHEMSRLFDAFFTSYSVTGFEDTGARMALARRIIESTGGGIKVESRNVGFRVQVQLPLAAEVSQAFSA